MAAPHAIAGFRTHLLESDGTPILVHEGGTGPAVLLLHGFPETGLMWHALAPLLADLDWELHPGPLAPHGDWPVETREEFAVAGVARADAAMSAAPPRALSRRSTTSGWSPTSKGLRRSTTRASVT